MTRGRTQVLVRLGLAIVAVSALVACSGGGGGKTEAAADRPREGTDVEPSLEPLAAATLRPGDAVPAPSGEALLTFTGQVTNTNVGDTVAFDLETIERIGTVTFRVYEPYEKKALSFQGVRFEDLLAVAGVDPDATELHLVALDDYVVDLEVGDIEAGGVMLATKTGAGREIPVSEGGPTRLVFLKGSKPGDVPNNWIWSMETVEVR